MNGKNIYMRLKPESYEPIISQLLEILLPQYSLHFLRDEESVDGPVVQACITKADEVRHLPIVTEISLVKDGVVLSHEQRSHFEILDPRYRSGDYEKRGKDLLKSHIYTFLVRKFNEKLSPWGILTGVRPTKLLHYLRDDGFSFDEIGEILRDVYAISDEKIDLLVRIGQMEEGYLPSRADAFRRVSIYLGIPFCPSRCIYCSFPAFSLQMQKHGRFLEPFLEALFKEIAAVGRFIESEGLKVDSIYLGGGTPTSLSTGQMERLLRHIQAHLPLGSLLEYNVEAGRPDTINPEKLKVMHDCGVRRISVNPQTMQQKTLDIIGRCHTVEDISQVYQWAREAGFDNINMDLIVGLPGENFADVQSTINQVLTLKPDSVTVHTLSLKKASSWWEVAKNLPFPEDEEVTRMLEYIDRVLKEHQLLPYYMYRQKYILGNQENVGYALPGKESLYNMIMIDERETVIGLGGGAVTKVVNPLDWSLTRHVNPKYPGDYIMGIDKFLEEKLSMLTSVK